jgi:hypothetical protein
MGNGKENAVKLRIDSALALNEFYTERDGKEELVSAKRNEGGFVHVAEVLEEDENNRNTFKCDMLITGIFENEGDPERNLPAKTIVKGYIFNFRNQLLPVEFSAIDPNAQKYFMRQECSPNRPFCTWVRGKVVSQTVVIKETEESAFGGSEVRERKTSVRDYVITGANPEPYSWDDEAFITAKEMSEALATREVDLAAMKKRGEDYRQAKSAPKNEASAFGTVSAGNYGF